MEKGEDVWDELWENLHHQGDVGIASYASVPHLVRIEKFKNKRDWNLYALAATIEIERFRKTNPPVPDWLLEDYEKALGDLFQLGLADIEEAEHPLMIRSILGVFAISRGDLKLGALLTFLESSEIVELLENQQAWSELYHIPNGNK